MSLHRAKRACGLCYAYTHKYRTSTSYKRASWLMTRDNATFEAMKALEDEIHYYDSIIEEKEKELNKFPSKEEIPFERDRLRVYRATLTSLLDACEGCDNRSPRIAKFEPETLFGESTTKEQVPEKAELHIVK